MQLSLRFHLDAYDLLENEEYIQVCDLQFKTTAFR